MRLIVATPLAVVVDEDGVLAVQAEDSSGSFGILPGHADLQTNLVVSVLSWKGSDGKRHFCATRRGCLTVSGGTDVAIATSEAILGDDLATLHQTVLERFRADLDAERREHAEATRLQLVAIRQIVRHLRPDGASRPGEFA